MKKFIKPTFLKIIITFILIIIFIFSRRIVMQLESPAENIFFKIDLIIFKPAEYIINIFNSFNLTYLGNIFYFLINIIEYYLMASILVLIFNKIKKLIYSYRISSKNKAIK
jgi:hypothetical protein